MLQLYGTDDLSLNIPCTSIFDTFASVSSSAWNALPHLVHLEAHLSRSNETDSHPGCLSWIPPLSQVNYPIILYPEASSQPSSFHDFSLLSRNYYHIVHPIKINPQYSKFCEDRKNVLFTSHSQMSNKRLWFIKFLLNG